MKGTYYHTLKMGRRRRSLKVDISKTLPEGCQHFEHVHEVPWDVQKYFQQRYNLFSRYDEGIWMTDDAWFGVTPEPVSSKIAQHVAAVAPRECHFLLDCFSGVGGNAIAFALTGRWTKVYAIEKDAAALQCAKHNAEIYGVQDLISWHLGDCFDVLRSELHELRQNCTLFASPPWGGPGYRSDQIFDLSTMQPYNLSCLMSASTAMTHYIILYLPRSSDLRQLAQFCEERGGLTIIHYCMEGASKALCAYFGSCHGISTSE